MSRVQDYYWDIVAGKPCFGTYQPSQLCDHCWAAEFCKLETIKLDGHYDELERKKSALEELIDAYEYS